MPFPARYALCLAGLLVTSSCAVVYAPTVPATPVLQQGQVEVTAGLRGLVAGEATAAWAPTRHLLLLGEAATRGGGEGSYDTIRFRNYHRQAGLGLGYYRAPTARSPVYLAAVAGLGYAAADQYAVDTNWFLFLPVPTRVGHFEARYRRYYGQLYVAWPHERSITPGVSLRGTVVDYLRLTLDDVPIRPTNRVFLEPSVFLRFGHGSVRGQATAGFSLPLVSRSYDPANARTAPVSWLFGAGLVLRPDLLFRR